LDNSYLRRQPLNYIGFDGQGHQVRLFASWDLGELIWKQMKSPDRQVERVQNVGGGVLRQCLCSAEFLVRERFGKHRVGHDSASAPYDFPWMVLDPTRAERQWDWQPTLGIAQILEEIARHAEAHAEWLEISGCI
jgi:CDP-paratose 2-epimerase